MTSTDLFIILGICFVFIGAFAFGGTYGKQTAEKEIQDTINYCQEVRDTSFHDCLHKRYSK